MNHSIQNLPTSISISIPIPESARQIAQTFAQEQFNPEKARQVYLNTLSVLVVNTYLQMLDIPTDLENSHSWSAIGRLCADVADLAIEGIGTLECRPVRINANFCPIPAEVWHNRIGYVIVEIDTACQAGKILGFLPQVTSMSVDINQLQSLESLLEHLYRFRLVQLRQWLMGTYETRWEPVEKLFGQAGQTDSVMAFRSPRFKGVELNTPEKIHQAIAQLFINPGKGVGRELEQLKWANKSNIDLIVNLLQTIDDEEIRWNLAEILWMIDPDHPLVKARRILDLGMLLVGHPIALMVGILQKLDHTFAILTRLYPMEPKSYLPPGVKLIGLYENGEPFQEIQSRSKDDYIQFKFSAESREKFSIRVSLEDVMITENFIL